MGICAGVVLVGILFFYVFSWIALGVSRLLEGTATATSLGYSAPFDYFTKTVAGIPLRDGILTFLLASSLDMIDKPRAEIESRVQEAEPKVAALPDAFGSGIALPGFWLSRYEITNVQFKRFVDAGGYQKDQYWTEPITPDGRTLSRREARS